MIMMPYSWRWSSLQLTGQADFWHPTGPSRCQARLGGHDEQAIWKEIDD